MSSSTASTASTASADATASTAAVAATTSTAPAPDNDCVKPKTGVALICTLSAEASTRKAVAYELVSALKSV